MSQHDFDIANQTASAARADINSALQALASSNSGATAPTTTYPNMLWYETDTNILKMRNEADSAWINLFYIDQASNVVKILEGTYTSTTSGTPTGILAPHADATWNTGTNTEPRLVSPAQLKTVANASASANTISGGYAYLSRSSGVGYQNTRSTPVIIYFDINYNVGNAVYVSPTNGSWILVYSGSGSGDQLQGTLYVPAGHWYLFNAPAGFGRVLEVS